MATRGFKMQSKKYKPYICYSDDYNVINESFDPTYDFGCGYSYTKISKKLLKNLYLHQLRRNFSLVARCSLKFTRCSLLVVKSLITRCKFARYLSQKFLVAKKSLVTRFRSCSLQKITCYSLQISLATRCRSYSLQKITRYSLQNWLVTHCSYSLRQHKLNEFDSI